MKLCFEGPSGIGKTTLSQRMTSEYQVIPEVNLLFKGEQNKGELWYYKKQVQRYQLADQHEQAIFDGDPFQPIWYNWSYNFPEGYLSPAAMYNFYAKEIRAGNIQFPNMYFLFHTNEQNLRSRKENDRTRSRRNFEKHLKLTQTLPLYFGFMKEQFPNLVEFVTYNTVDEAYKQVLKRVNRNTTKHSYDSLMILNYMIDWISSHHP